MLYGQQLATTKVLTPTEVEASRKRISDRLNAAFDANKAAGPWVLNPAVTPAREILFHRNLARSGAGG